MLRTLRHLLRLIVDAFFQAPGVVRTFRRAGYELAHRDTAAEWESEIITILQASGLKAILDRYDINCVLDVGANRGQFAEELRAAKFEGYIISFEPNKEIFSKLQEMACRDPKWTVHNVALGRADELKELNIMKSSVFSSFHPPMETQEVFADANQVIARQQTMVQPLDDLLDDLLPADASPYLFLKVDTQGFDMEVIAGAHKTLQRCAGVQTEVSVTAIYEGSPPYAESLSTLEGLGFVISGLYLVTRNRDTREAIEFDCVMVNKEL
jgi:FkbM family methyltransferase